MLGITKSHKTRLNKETVLNRRANSCTGYHSSTLAPGLSIEGTVKNTHLPVFSWKEFDCILYKLRIQLLFNMHFSDDCKLSQSLKGLVDTSLIVSLWLAPTTKISQKHHCRRSMSIYLAPHLSWIPSKGWTPK